VAVEIVIERGRPEAVRWRCCTGRTRAPAADARRVRPREETAVKVLPPGAAGECQTVNGRTRRGVNEQDGRLEKPPTITNFRRAETIYSSLLLAVTPGINPGAIFRWPGLRVKWSTQNIAPGLFSRGNARSQGKEWEFATAWSWSCGFALLPSRASARRTRPRVTRRGGAAGARSRSSSGVKPASSRLLRTDFQGGRLRALSFRPRRLRGHNYHVGRGRRPNLTTSSGGPARWPGGLRPCGRAGDKVGGVDLIK